MGVAADPRGEIGGGGEVAGEAFGRGGDGVGGGDVGQKIAEGEGRGAQLDLAGLDFGEVEHVVDHAQEVFAAGLDDAEALLLIGRHAGIGLEHLGVADDAVERRAQLVAHSGEEGTFRAVGGLGLIAGGGEFGGAGGDEGFEAGAFAFAAAEAPADVSEEGGERREHVGGDGPAGEPEWRGDGEGEERGRSETAEAIAGADLELVTAGGQGEVADLGVGGPGAPFGIPAGEARLVFDVGAGGEMRSLKTEDVRMARVTETRAGGGEGLARVGGFEVRELRGPGGGLGDEGGGTEADEALDGFQPDDFVGAGALDKDGAAVDGAEGFLDGAGRGGEGGAAETAVKGQTLGLVEIGAAPSVAGGGVTHADGRDGLAGLLETGFRDEALGRGIETHVTAIGVEERAE